MKTLNIIIVLPSYLNEFSINTCFMEEFKKIENLADHVREYVDTNISLMKLRFVEKTSKLVAWLIAVIILFFVLFSSFIFFSLSASHGIGDALGKPWLGFLIVGVLYLLLGIIIWTAKEKFIRIPFMNAMLRQIFSEDYLDKNGKD